MTRRRPTHVVLALLVATVAPTLKAASPTSVPSTAPAGLDVREWVVLDVDATANLANGRGSWPSTLPPFVTSRRGAAEAGSDNRARPVGVIHLYGTIDPKLPVDVLLNLPGGETEATWPRAQVKSGRLLWPNLLAADTDAGPPALEGQQWLAPLRQGDAVTLRSDRQIERFLLYDVALKYTTPLRVQATAGTVRVSNASSTPLHDLVLYKKRNGQWTRATPGTLVGVPPSPAAVPTTTKADPASAFDGPTTLPTSRPISTAPATSQATTEPATQATSRPAETGVAVTLAAVPESEVGALVSPWKSILLDAGVPQSDVGTVLAVLASSLADDPWLTAVYRIDAAELDRLLPLEVVPSPRRTTRVGLVVVHGADPAIADEIDRLIAECGSPDYAKREAATAGLIAIGGRAKDKLQRAQSNVDIEIAQRAEAILEATGGAKKN